MNDYQQNRNILELRQRIEKLERTVEFLLQKLNLQYQDTRPVDHYHDLRVLVQQGNKLEAMRLYRERTGVSLNEAKVFIDSLD